jgi:hypothetical protein
MGVEALTEDSKGNIWFGGSEGLFRFSPEKKHFYRLSYKTLIRKVVAKDDSLVFGGAFFVKKNNSNFISEKQTHKVILPYSHNKIAFYFSAASYEEPKSTLFSYKLENFDKDWSAWQRDSKSDYTNLLEGEYKFRVRSKNIFGVIGEEAEFSFVIQPPFYRTYFAYFLYALATVLILHFLIKFNTRRLRKQNEQLEKIISERTAEVMAQKNALAGKNVELEQQKEEILVQAENLRELNNEVSEANLMLEKKNSEVETALKDIKAGINYALRIQSAMLPKRETLQKYLSDFFIFFRPRDTVSGDFYWFEHIEEKNISILALADCTGHGVPGAFMSLIGKDTLDKIVLNNAIFSPAKILDALDSGIKISLKQEDSSVRDGMDIGICVWLHEENKLLFAGAKQNLTTIFDQEIFEWAGNKVSIAAVRRPENFVFTETEIDLSKYPSAKFYLFSDGIQDQFGGKEGKKITKKLLKEWLLETQTEEMTLQGKNIEAKIDQWLHFSSDVSTRQEEQIDDMLLIGFCLSA